MYVYRACGIRMVVLWEPGLGTGQQNFLAKGYGLRIMKRGTRKTIPFFSEKRILKIPAPGPPTIWANIPFAFEVADQLITWFIIIVLSPFRFLENNNPHHLLPKLRKFWKILETLETDRFSF